MATKTPEAELDDLMKLYGLSVRNVAALLQVNTSSIVHWQTGRNRMSSGSVVALNALKTCLKALMEKDDLTAEEAVTLVLAFRKTRLWHGIDSVPKSFGRAHVARTPVEIEKLICDQLDQIERGLKIVGDAASVTKGAIKGQRYFDFVCKDKNGLLTAIEIKSGTVDKLYLQNIITSVALAKKLLSDKARFVLLAEGFSDEFIAGAEQIKGLSMMTFLLEYKLIINAV